MKDVLITYEVKYEIHCCAKENEQWGVLSVVGDTEYDSLRKAKRVIAKLKETDRRYELEFRYRIAKLTIKKEVVYDEH